METRDNINQEEGREMITSSKARAEYIATVDKVIELEMSGIPAGLERFVLSALAANINILS